MKQLLTRSGLTPKQLADKVGYRHDYINAMLRGAKPVSSAVRAYLELRVKCKEILDE